MGPDFDIGHNFFALSEDTEKLWQEMFDIGFKSVKVFHTFTNNGTRDFKKLALYNAKVPYW